MDDVVLARALHVLAVVHWIGGVAFVTLVGLPQANARGGAEGLALFGAIGMVHSDRGASGVWMTYRMDVWYRFGDLHFWWMSAMAGLWLVFALMVVVLEPLLHPRFEAEGRHDPIAMLRRNEPCPCGSARDRRRYRPGRCRRSAGRQLYLTAHSTSRWMLPPA